MTKSSFYNRLVDLYKTTGQGFLRIMYNSEAIDELITEGKVKEVHQRYNHLPDDVWICLTNVYCVEEDCNKSGSTLPLTYMRMYLGHIKVIDLGQIQLTLLDAIKDPELMSGYSKWLSENAPKIKLIDSIPEMVETDMVLSKEEVGFVKTRGWYKDNLVISSCIYKIQDGLELTMEELEKRNQLALLYKQRADKTGYTSSDMEQNEKLIDDAKKEINQRKRVSKFLSTKDKNIRIQEVV